MRRPLLSALFVGAVVFAAAAVSARADMTQTLRPGQSFVGDVPPGETMRLTVELAAGAEIRLQFSLLVTGADRFLPANFQRVSVTDEDGKPVEFDQRLWTTARYDVRKRTSTFKVRGWKPEAGGRYTFAVTHLTQVATRCSGRVATVRTLRTKFEGDETGASFTIPVQPDDTTSVNVRKVDGTAPQIASYEAPGGTPVAVSQKRSKKGSSSRPMGGFSFGDATWRIGYQEPGPAAGHFKGTIVLRPGGPYGRTVLQLSNSPGIALSVRNVDAFVDATWALSGAGVSWDGQFLLVTGETNNEVRAKYYNADLTDPGPLSSPALLASSGDLPPGETIRGHRLLRAADRHFLAFTSASGRSAALAKFPFNLVREGFTPVVDGSTVPTTDLFLAADDFSVSVGIPRPPLGHTVHVFDAAAMTRAGAPVEIGTASRPHAEGASAVFRRDQNVFEFWAPDSVAPGIPSDLNHGLFTPAWGALTWEPARIADPNPNVIETMCTSVVYDAESGVTIVHWVEPTVDTSGLGVLHRRLFDPLGVEIPNSHATLGTVRRGRPAATIAGDSLYVAAEGETNTSVTRFQLLR